MNIVGKKLPVVRVSRVTGCKGFDLRNGKYLSEPGNKKVGRPRVLRARPDLRFETIERRSLFATRDRRKVTLNYDIRGGTFCQREVTFPRVFVLRRIRSSNSFITCTLTIYTFGKVIDKYTRNF